MDKMCRNQVHIKHSHAHKIAIEDEHFKLLFSYFMFKLFCLCDRYSQRHLLPVPKYIRLECVKFAQNWIKFYLCLVKQKAFVFSYFFGFGFVNVQKLITKCIFISVYGLTLFILFRSQCTFPTFRCWFFFKFVCLCPGQTSEI